MLLAQVYAATDLLSSKTRSTAKTVWEIPRLCRGGSRGLTFAEIHWKTLRREPPSAREEVFTMDEYESLSHTKWDCKYPVVSISKCRRKTLYGKLRRNPGEVFHQLVSRRRAGSRKGA